MKNIKKITDDLYYIGCSDRRIALFENVYPVDDGVSYNTYFLKDDKTVLFDTIDKHVAEQFFENLEYLLNGKTLDYLFLHHLEPDHGALIKEVIEKYPSVKIVANAKIKQMLFQFFEFKKDIENNFHIVKEGDTIKTGKHEFTFYMAPMVHWPEVMVSYDKTDMILFSADAFGSFGALNGNIFDDEVNFMEKIPEYRRYYSNIVGKYGTQVNMLLNKAKNLEIEMICPLHGLIIRKNIAKMFEKYILWSNYIPEEKSVLIVYASVYGGTQNAAEVLSYKLSDLGVKNMKIYDVSKTHRSFILSDAFKYSHIVIASTTYNNGIFVNMEHFISDIIKHNLQHRTYAIIENGSWACNCGASIKDRLSELKGSNFIKSKLTIKSSIKNSQEAEVENLAKEIKQSLDDLVNNK